MKIKFNLISGVFCFFVGTATLIFLLNGKGELPPVIINYVLSFINLSIFYFSNRK